MYFFTAILIAKSIGTFRSILTAKILQPSDYGIWITVLLITSYAPIVSFGTVEALLKRFPYYIGMGELSKAKELENGVLGSIILSTALLVLVGFTFHRFIDSQSLESLLPIVRLMVIASALSFYSAFFYNQFKAHQNFKIVSIIDMSRSVLTFLLVVSFSWFWGLRGTVFGFFINELIICVFSAILSNSICGRLALNFNLSLIGNLIRTGFPITIIWWIFIVQTSADRIISMSMLGKTATGYYGLGVALVSIIILLPQAVGQVLYPRVNEKLGECSRQQDLSGLVIEPARALSLLLPVMIGVLVLISPIIYNQVLPKYSNGLASAQILLLGSFFVCLIRTGTNFLIATNKQNILLRYFLLSLAVNIAGNITLVKLGLNIEGIAISTSISGALLTTLVWKSVFQSMGFSRFDKFKGLFGLYLPFMLLLGIIGICMLVLPNLLTETGVLSLIHSIIFICLFSTILCTVPPFSKCVKEIYHLLKTNVKTKRQPDLVC